MLLLSQHNLVFFKSSTLTRLCGIYLWFVQAGMLRHQYCGKCWENPREGPWKKNYYNLNMLGDFYQGSKPVNWRSNQRGPWLTLQHFITSVQTKLILYDILCKHSWFQKPNGKGDPPVSLSRTILIFVSTVTCPSFTLYKVGQRNDSMPNCSTAVLVSLALSSYMMLSKLTFIEWEQFREWVVDICYKQWRFEFITQ